MKDRDRVAKAFNVPPWLVDPATPVPRFPRLRWFLLQLKWRLS